MTSGDSFQTQPFWNSKAGHNTSMCSQVLNKGETFFDLLATPLQIQPCSWPPLLEEHAANSCSFYCLWGLPCHLQQSCFLAILDCTAAWWLYCPVCRTVHLPLFNSKRFQLSLFSSCLRSLWRSVLLSSISDPSTCVIIHEAAKCALCPIAPLVNKCVKEY